MSLTIILAVGVDSALLASQKPFWQSAGCYVVPARSIRDAIVQFRDGDFDLIFLGRSLPVESREKLTFLIRSSGSQIPVVFVADSPGGHDTFADATIRNEGDVLLQVIEDFMSKRTKAYAAAQPCEAR